MRARIETLVGLAVALFTIYHFRIAEPFGLLALLPWIGGGFVVHAACPKRFRSAVFLAVSLAGLVVVLGLVAAGLVIGLGLGLIGIAHLPISPKARVLLATVAGAGLAWLRAGEPHYKVLIVVLPVLGAMFMFRLMLYLYDGQRRNDASWSQRLSYFFMLPNVVFPLFPVVDYRTWIRSWYAVDAWVIYRRGVGLIARGITHILLYRALYHYATPDPIEVTSLLGLAWFMASTYGLYLRISGQFHIIVGILCLFGHNLPDTHHLYFISNGFTDLWRRINVYWRDFMVKLIYFPVFFRARRRGPRFGMLAATGAVFLGTWLFHSYQWFWLRGSFPLTAVDAIFWTVFGVLIAIGSLWEMRGKGKNKSEPSLWRRAATGLATFAGMCVLWSFISSPTVSDWWHLVRVAGNASLTDVLWIGLALMVLWLVFAAFLAFETDRDPSQSRTIIGPLSACAIACIVAWPTVPGLSASAVEVAQSLRKNRLNERDQRLMERGYYENVLDMDRYLAQLWKGQLQRPAGWDSVGLLNVQDPELPFMWRLRPNLDVTFKRARLTTNATGMRDRTYSQVPAPGTWRMALLGGSGSMGSGVADGANFESLTELELGRGHGNVEILNFAVPGYDHIRRYWHARDTVFDFAPNVVVVESIGLRDGRKLIDHLVMSVRRGYHIPYPPAAAVVAEVEATADLPESEIYRRLLPHADALTRAAYRDLVTLARSHGATPVWMYLPLPGERPNSLIEAEEAASMARGEGFVVMTLAGAFDGYAPEDLRIAPWDGHPNALAHQLLSQRLVAEITRLADELGLPP